MECRTDIADLLSNLERLCRECRAMRLLLEEDNQRWRADVRRLSSSRNVTRDVEGQFREVRANLQWSEFDSAAIRRLIAVVQEYLLPDLPKQ